MPASRARIIPGAASRFEMTTTMVASRVPSRIASMIACRFDPRPEIRTASRFPVGEGIRSDVADRAVARDDQAEAARVRLAAGANRVDDAVDVSRRAGDDQANPHVER